MFDNNQEQNINGGFIKDEKFNFKKYLPIVIVSFSVLLFVLILIFIFTRKKEEPVIVEEPKEGNGEIIATLPSYPSLGGLNNNTDIKLDPALDEEIEKLTFIQFFDAPNEVLNLNYLSYELPIDVKTEVVNYYEFNRRVNLDPYLDNLSKNGFSEINNPWPENAKDFYSAYNILIDNQIPLFISSDFLLYHYNLVLKKVWQEIENSFFYDSLWDISIYLFNNSKRSYENYLSQVGQINDPILEAKRLRLAYFAVALELLKPQERQVESESLRDSDKFTKSEFLSLVYDLPTYLEDEVLSEARLIREAEQTIKSPVLLYEMDYENFIVPRSYRETARKNNYFLAKNWLNSLFPLNYQSEVCPNCLLDINDWRINFTSSAMIVEDISNSQFLKAEWARVYKIYSFFAGLEDSLTYTYFKKDFEDLFDNKSVIDVFSLENEDSFINLETYRDKLKENIFKEIQGGIDLSLEENQAHIGFRLLANSYWPTNYLNKKLTHPNVGRYLDTRINDNNISSCRIEGFWQRCFSFFGDSLNLLGLEINSDYFFENTNYQNYKETLFEIEAAVKNALSARSNAFWSQLASLDFHLKTNDSALPVFAKNDAWQERMAFGLGSALLDWEMPADNFKRLMPENEAQANLGMSPIQSSNVYIEPTLNLINDLLANTEMISKKFSALGADSKSNLAMVNLDSLYSDLNKLSEIAENSLEKQNLSRDDQSLIINWLSSYEIVDKANKIISKTSSNERLYMTQSLNRLKFLVIIFPTEDGPVLALSPIFNLQEVR